jgi:hypothetical protein
MLRAMAWTNSPLIVYHGTVQPSADDILRNGISLSKCKAINDFGLGFYVTTSLEQAKQRAKITYRKASFPARRAALSPSPGTAAVIEFSMDRRSLASLDALVFVLPNRDWRDFIAYCRSNGRNHFPNGSFYDVVYGPVSLIGGEAKPDSDQISLHSVSAIQVLATRRQMLGNPTFL